MRDHGLLPADSIARRIDREMFILLGGTAALLLQIAHPLVAAGVDQHSDFRRAPHGRLLRTLDTTLSIVFGDSETARRAMARINRRHVAVRGLAADGSAYDARDPALLLWVQCTLVLTSLRLYELVMGRLSDAERQAYWEEAKLIVAGLGLPRHLVPASVADLETYERIMFERTVIPDATSRAVARSVLRPYPRIPDRLWWPADAVTAGLLPGSLRRAFGLRYGTRERAAFRAAILTMRMAVPFAPSFLRFVPHARRRCRR
jgi:uncharacterized protein (DUF2236 family)